MPRTRFARHLLAAVALAAAAPSVLAANTFDLRVLAIQINWTTQPDEAPIQLADWFADGALQTGVQATGLSAPNPLYAVSGSAPVLSVPGDLSLDGNAVGQVTFSQATASALAPITVNGNPFLDQNNRITLRENNLAAGYRNFAGSTAWNFVTPDANTRYGMRFTDASASPAFNDVISMDVVRMGSGAAGVQMRRLSSDGLGNITSSQAQTFSLASGLFGGYSLADVDLVALHMYWDPLNGVFGDMEMINVADGGATITQVGGITFSNHYAIFNGESYTRLQAGASWTLPAAPVPEPASLGLMAAGLAALGATAHRRRAG